VSLFSCAFTELVSEKNSNYDGDQIKVDEIGKACSMNRRENKYVQRRKYEDNIKMYTK
jgi:hypothetical protein